MFDPRTYLPASPTTPDFSGLTMRETMRALCGIVAARQTPGTPEHEEFERKQIDLVAAWIEENALDEIELSPCKDVFKFNALIHMRDHHPNPRQYNNDLKVAAANQVWHKYNH
ncbi:hypothetical protein SHV42_09375 [Pseudomonas capeferrum]|uniref:hypothetical protein n=1 Tax=Pseudomonas capeferrum TaxID=1495066 RepID=UPI00397BBBDA